MRSHALADTVACLDHDQRQQEMSVTIDNRRVVLWLPGEVPLWFEIPRAERFAYLLLANSSAARHGTPP